VAVLRQQANLGDHEKAIVQALGWERVGSSERYRIKISDGAQSCFGMLATQLNGYIKDSQLKAFTLVSVQPTPSFFLADVVPAQM